MKKIANIKKAIEGRIKSNEEHIAYLHTRIGKNFRSAYEVGHAQDLYQTVVETEYIKGALDEIIGDEYDAANLFRLEQYATAINDQILNSRPASKHYTPVMIAGMAEAVIFLRNAMKYSK